MPVLKITKTYADGDVLLASDLTQIKTNAETLVNTTLLDDDNIQNNAITTAKIIDGTVTATTLANQSITSSKIEALAVTTAKITDSAVATADIADDAVTSAKLAALSVTSAKVLQTGTDLTNSQLLARPYWVSSTRSSYSVTLNSSSYTTVFTAAVSRTGTVTSRPFIAMLQGAVYNSQSYIRVDGGIASGTAFGLQAKFTVNGSDLNNVFLLGADAGSITGTRAISIPTSTYFTYFHSSVASFNVTFDISRYGTINSGSFSIYNTRLIVVEL